MQSVTFALFIGLSVLAAFVFLSVHGFGSDFKRTYEVMLPTRDNVLLHTRVCLPRSYQPGMKYATIVDRSPYGYTHLELLIDLFLPFGFVTIGQDMRGTEKSEGVFTIWHSDNNDSQDMGDWIVQQEWSNGKVYSFGASADGIASFTMVANDPGWLYQQYIVWATSIGYEIILPNGAYLENLATVWISSTVPQSADENLQELKENEARTTWWDPLDLRGKYDLVRGKSGFWAGWYDIFLLGTLEAFRGYNDESDPSVRSTSMLLIDPLGHCQDGAQYFPQDLIMGRTLLGLIQAYELYEVLPAVVRPGVKNITIYVMSSYDDAGLSAGNYWSSFEKFPTPTMINFYIHGDRSVSTSAPTAGELESTSFVYDPSNPVPSMGGNNLEIKCGPLLQNDIDERSDVVYFQTTPFTSDQIFTGPIFATLYVSSDAIDTDFVVRISDVYPTGEVRLLQDNNFRMRWREGGLTPVNITKGEVYEITLTLWNTSYIIATTHSLRVSITSSNYPRFSVNRNNGVLLKATDPGPFITANNVIYHSAQYPSHISLPSVRKIQLTPLPDIRRMFEEAYPQINVDEIMKKYPNGLVNFKPKKLELDEY